MEPSSAIVLSPPPPRPRRKPWLPAAVVGLLLAGAYALHPWLIPLVNPTTEPYRARVLQSEVHLASALTFQEMLPDFWLFDTFVQDHGRLLSLSQFALADEVRTLRAEAVARAERQAARALAADADPGEAIAAARVLLQQGRSERACEVLEATVRVHEQGGDLGRLPRELLWALAGAHMRRAETRNCVGHHTADSCIYPIQGEGVHVDPEPARRALELYTLLASRDPDDVGARWLAGIAASTLGETSPLAASPRHGLAPFPRLRDTALEAGIFDPKRARSGGGTLLEDFDGDGRLDLFFGGYLPDDQVLYYRGRGDGAFVDRTKPAGLMGELGAFRLNQADVDNDGDLDVLLVRGGWITPGRNTLLINEGGWFRDGTAQAGLGDEAEPTMAAAWADWDGDGWIDLALANLVQPQQRGEGLRLYRNRGDGTFQDVSRSAGLPSLRLCAGLTWGDVDEDGDPDLYVSVAFGQNFLFRNERGHFVDRTFRAGVARPVTGFPCWFFDADDDGHLDLFAASFWPVFEEELADLTGVGRPPSPAAPLRLYRGRGDGTFTDVTAEQGLLHAVSTMGANHGDLDSDGRLDVYLGTGSPYLAHLVPNRFFHNTPLGFRDATISAGLGHLQKGHGVAFGDVDEDGDLDLVVNMGGAVPVDRFQPSLFTNPGNGNRWLEVRLEGTDSNRAAIGARLTLTLEGGRRLHRTVASGGPFGASPLAQWFGLGASPGALRLKVAWPSGRTEVYEDLRPDRRYLLREGAE
jgi:hypothetical protein